MVSPASCRPTAVLPESPPCVPLPQHLIQREFHGRLPTQKFQEDGDALARRQDLRDHGFQSLERSACQLHRFSHLGYAGQNAQFFLPEDLSQILDDGGGNRRPPVTEMNDAADTGRMMDAAQGRFPAKARKEIIGKQSFSDPRNPLARLATKTDSRQKNFDPVHLTEVARGDVFMFRLCPQAEPGDYILWLRVAQNRVLRKSNHPQTDRASYAADIRFTRVRAGRERNTRCSGSNNSRRSWVGPR